MITKDLSGPGGGFSIANLEIEDSDLILRSVVDGTFINREYDHGGRVIGSSLGLDENELELVGSYKYNDNDWKIKHSLGGDLENALQHMDYDYNARGWLTKINDLDDMKANVEDALKFFNSQPQEDDVWTSITGVTIDYDGQKIWDCLPTAVRFQFDALVTNTRTEIIYEKSYTRVLGLNGGDTSQTNFNDQLIFDVYGPLNGQIISDKLATEIEEDFAVGDENICNEQPEEKFCSFQASAGYQYGNVYCQYEFKSLYINGENIIPAGLDLCPESASDRVTLEGIIENYLSAHGGQGTAQVTLDGVLFVKINNASTNNSYNYFELVDAKIFVGTTTLSHFTPTSVTPVCIEMNCDYKVQNIVQGSCSSNPNKQLLSALTIKHVNILGNNVYDLSQSSDRSDLKEDIKAYLDANGYEYSSVSVSSSSITIDDTDASFDGVYLVCPQAPGNFQILPFVQSGCTYSTGGGSSNLTECEEILCDFFNGEIPSTVDIIGIIDDILGDGGDLPNVRNCDMFAEDIVYHDLKDDIGGNQYFAGNISYTKAMTGDSRVIESYVYDYDRRDQVMAAKHWQEYLYSAEHSIWKWRNPNLYNTSYSYDAGGNILSINRSGVKKRHGNGLLEFGAIDDLNFTYGQIPNRVNSIVENQNLPDFIDHGFKGIGGDLDHDDNGNITVYGPDGITEIQYDIFNYPKLIKFADGRKVELIYDSEGFKHKMVFKLNNTKLKTYSYGSNRVHITDHEAGGTTEEYYNFDGGRHRYTSEEDKWSYEYVLRDHLGNGRVWVKDLNDDGVINCTPIIEDVVSEITQIEHYYPFGMSWDGGWKDHLSSLNQIDNDHRYNSKQDFTGDGLEWMDYGARWYDSSVGRFMQLDALASHPNQIDKSPYAYAWNSPIKITDPDGNCPNCIIGALIGATVDIAFQMAQNRIQDKAALDNINYASVALSALSGAASGGVSTLNKVGKFSKLAMDTGINATESIANQAIEGDVSVGQTISDVTTGFIAGKAEIDGPVNTKFLERDADRAVRIALKSDKSAKVKNAVAAEKKLNTANNINNTIETGLQDGIESSMQSSMEAFQGGAGSNSMITPMIQSMPRDNTIVVMPALSAPIIKSGP